MKKIITIGILIYSSLLLGQSPQYPFPNHTVYTANHIRPDNYSQTELDNQTKSFYDEWKAEYLKNDCGNTNEYYVYSGDGAKNVSEAQGYGMMIAAYFAGYDSNAKTLLDGLYLFYKSHPSNINNSLMDWQQVTCSDTPSSDDDAASDGDIDIAFALLLAHEQWGSNGTIDYLTEAQTIINAIMQDEINQSKWTVKLGDWCDASDPGYYYGTRPSDFITDHFRIFSCITNDTNWDSVVDTCYALIENMQTNYSPLTGLLPDFVINLNTNSSPAGANYLEDVYDGDYYYNACRVSWRIGTDYLINGEGRAKNTVNKINSWLISSTSANVSNISNGYNLNGTAIYNWNDATFIGPFTVGAMADINNQTWLNDLYEDLLTNNDLSVGDYYSNTIKLLSMITISENYWIPNCSNSGISQLNLSNDDVNIYPNSTSGIINIEFKNKQITNSKIIGKIVDIKGEVIVDNLSLHNSQQIDISTFENGVYLLSIIVNNTKIITKKIVKE